MTTIGNSDTMRHSSEIASFTEIENVSLECRDAFFVLSSEIKIQMEYGNKI